MTQALDALRPDRSSAGNLPDKVRDPQDGRRFRLCLTDDGLRNHRKPTVRTARTNQVFPVPLPAADQTRFFDLVRRVSDAAEGLRDPTERPVAQP